MGARGLCTLSQFTTFSLPLLCSLHALPATLKGEALLTGAPLRQLMKSREEKFEQRFTQTFGQVSGDDLPAGIFQLENPPHPPPPPPACKWQQNRLHLCCQKWGGCVYSA